MDYNFEENEGYVDLEVEWEFILPFNESTLKVLGEYHAFFKFRNPPGYGYNFTFYRVDAKREF